MKVKKVTIGIFNEDEDIKKYFGNVLFYKYDIYLKKLSGEARYKIIKNRLGNFLAN